MVYLVAGDHQLTEKTQLALINIGSACRQLYYANGVCEATYMQLRSTSTPKVEHCPLRDDNSACGRNVYAKGVCKRCSRVNERKFSDNAYDSSPKGIARRLDYELSEKGQAKKRRYARKISMAKRVILYLRADAPLDRTSLIEEIMARYKVEESEAKEILNAAVAHAKSHPEL